LRERGALNRYFALDVLLSSLDSPSVVKVRTALNPNSKQSLFDEIKARNGEGVVFKKDDAPYVPGRPNSAGNMVKHKFVQDATCQVVQRNGNKRSVEIGVGEGVLGPLVSVGM